MPRRHGLTAMAAAFVMASSANALCPPEQPLVEYASNPRGVDGASPRFSFQLCSDSRAVKQTSYHITVRGTEGGRERGSSAWVMHGGRMGDKASQLGVRRRHGTRGFQWRRSVHTNCMGRKTHARTEHARTHAPPRSRSTCSPRRTAAASRRSPGRQCWWTSWTPLRRCPTRAPRRRCGWGERAPPSLPPSRQPRPARLKPPRLRLPPSPQASPTRPGGPARSGSARPRPPTRCTRCSARPSRCPRAPRWTALSPTLSAWVTTSCTWTASKCPRTSWGRSRRES
jgi:hypothetical protein